MMPPAMISIGAVPTLGLCFAACLIEGADIVSMGLVAPVIARQFGFGPAEMGYVLTAAIVGLMIGAASGGMLGDRWGRRGTVIIAFTVLGIGSILTAHAGSLGQLLFIRLLCGIGLGAALPNLIAIAADAAPPGRRATSIGMMFAGQPAGGALLGLFVASRAGVLDWTSVFYLGGILPLLLVPILIIALPEPESFRAARSLETGPPTPASLALFGAGRAPITLLLWASFGFTQVIVYLINNWLPTLMVAKGFSPQQAGAISSFENAGAVAGCIFLALATDLSRVRPVLMVTYAGMVAGLLALTVAQGFWPVAVVGIAVGFFVIGGQLILYTLAPSYYPVLVRGTGTGAAVSVGRVGGILGPLAAGKLIAMGLAPAGVLVAAVPFALVAGVAAVTLSLRPRQADSE